MQKLFKATYTGEPGIYKPMEYVLNIGSIEGRIVIKRKCGAGKKYYNNINEFLSEWSNIRKV
jgi:hypothetical protein